MKTTNERTVSKAASSIQKRNTSQMDHCCCEKPRHRRIDALSKAAQIIHCVCKNSKRRRIDVNTAFEMNTLIPDFSLLLPNDKENWVNETFEQEMDQLADLFSRLHITD